MHIPFQHKKLFLAVLAISLNHGVALADEESIPSIVVTASPIVDQHNMHSSMVDASVLKTLATSTSDTASLLKNIPGLNIQGAGGISGIPVIHGLADDRLRIKVDGMDLISACGNHMNPALSYLDPTNVGSAKVFAGISPVSIGGDSIGGTILVDSIAPIFAEPGAGLLTKGEIGSFYRSNDHARGGNIETTIASENISIKYQGSTAKAYNYEAGGNFKPAGIAAAGKGWLDSDEIGSSRYKSTNQSISLAMRHENHLIELKLSEQDIPYQGWPNQRMDMTDNNSKQFNFSYAGQYSWGDIETRIYHEKTRHKMQFSDDKLFWYAGMPMPNMPMPSMPASGSPCTPTGGMQGCAAGMPMDTEGKNTGATIKANINLSEQNLLKVGVEAQKYRLDDWWNPSGKGMWPNVFWNINDGERDRIALFTEIVTQWNPTWLTQFGIRGEQVDMNTDQVQGYNPTYTAEASAFNAADRSLTDHNIDLTALARFTPNDTHSIEFGYAMKTRSPNLYERYTWSTSGMAIRMINFAGDGNGYVGNLDLEAEIAHTASITFDWHDAAQQQWGLKITPYYTYIDDYIDAARCSSTVNAATSCTTANQTATNSFVYLQFANQSAHIYGVDISGYFPIAENTKYGSFNATGLLNYVRGKNKTSGDDLYNIMPINAKLAVTQNINNWTNTIEVELVDDKDHVSKTRNELETSSYGLVNLHSRYEWKHISIDIGVENLFDKFYRDPLGGAYFGQGMTMSATSIAWGEAVPAMGRSIYTGVNYKF